MDRLSRLLAAFALTITSPAVAADFQLIPNVSGSVAQTRASRVVAGQMAQHIIRSDTFLVDRDTGTIFNCYGQLEFYLINSVFQNETKSEARCRIVLAASFSALTTSWNFQAPLYNPQAPVDPGYQMQNRPAFYWQVAKDRVGVCIQAPVAVNHYPNTTAFGPTWCKEATIDFTKAAEHPEDPVLDLGDQN
ncbi:hypothetical protein NKH69_00030 [Mesorhizobium sp. M0976]|uniref:hypothetical protein n=1 Tax=unclassified Mesorhizobium TaxID=325217 RepID=UPI003339BDB8